MQFESLKRGIDCRGTIRLESRPGAGQESHGDMATSTDAPPSLFLIGAMNVYHPHYRTSGSVTLTRTAVPTSGFGLSSSSEGEGPANLRDDFGSGDRELQIIRLHVLVEDQEDLLTVLKRPSKTAVEAHGS